MYLLASGLVQGDCTARRVIETLSPPLRLVVVDVHVFGQSEDLIQQAHACLSRGRSNRTLQYCYPSNDGKVEEEVVIGFLEPLKELTLAKVKLESAVWLFLSISHPKRQLGVASGPSGPETRYEVRSLGLDGSSPGNEIQI